MLRIGESGNLIDVHASGTGIDDVLVEPALLIDGLWLARLNDAPMLEHVDLVGIDDLPDVMRDDDHRTSALDGVDAGLNLLCGDGVEAGRRLVEEDDRRVLDEHAGDGYALLLAATELERHRVEAVGQLHDLIVDIGLPCRSHHILVGSLRMAVLDILLDGAVEDMIFLKHEADMVAQPLGIPLVQLYTVETDGARIGMIELVEQVDERALPCPTESDEGRNLAAGDMHRDIAESLRAIAIGEVDARELEVALHRFRTVAARSLHLLVGPQDAEEALGIDEGVVHIVVDAMELTYRRTDIGEEHDVVHDLTNGHARIVNQHEVGRQDDDQHGAYLLKETLQTVEQIALLAHRELQARHLALQRCLALRFYLLTIEGLDDGDALDDVQYPLTDGLMASEDAAAPALHAAGLYIGDVEIDGDDAECHQSDIDVGQEHQHQGEERTREQRQYLDEEIVHRIAQAHDAAIDARLELTRLVAFCREESQAEGEHTLDNPQREVATDEDTHPLTVVSLEERDYGAHHLLAQEDHADDRQQANRTAPREAPRRLYQGIDAIDSPIEHDSVHLRHQRADQCQRQRDGYQPLEGQYVRQQRLQQPGDGHASCFVHCLIIK